MKGIPLIVCRICIFVAVWWLCKRETRRNNFHAHTGGGLEEFQVQLSD